MRPIDADALKTKIQKIKAEALEHGFAPESVCGDILLNFLDNAPTIEAKPVVHAHWEQVITVVKKIHEYEQEDIQYRCDHCGHIVDDFENYCGGCGAQMFEGVKIPVISMEDVPKIMEEMENNA